MGGWAVLRETTLLFSTDATVAATLYGCNYNDSNNNNNNDSNNNSSSSSSSSGGRNSNGSGGSGSGSGSSGSSGGGSASGNGVNGGFSYVYSDDDARVAMAEDGQGLVFDRVMVRERDGGSTLQQLRGHDQV